MEKIEFMSTASRPVTFFLDKITSISKFDATSTMIHTVGDPDGYMLFESYEKIMQKIEEAEEC